MEPIDTDKVISKFLENCRKSTKSKIRRAVQNISGAARNNLHRKLADALTHLPEARLRAYESDSVLCYVSWAINRRLNFADVHSWDSYRYEVETLLTVNLMDFLESQQ